MIFLKLAKLNIITFINLLAAAIFFLTTNGILWSKSVWVSFLYPVVPVYLLLNLLLLILFLVVRTWLAVVPVFICLLFLNQINLFFNPGLGRKSDEAELKVLSYNVAGFNVPNSRADKPPDQQQLTISDKMVSWINNDPSDIKCFQEFYHSEIIEGLNLIDKIHENGHTYYCYAFNKVGFGVITFSKHPIVNSGEIFKSDNGYNRGIFTDIKINQDTLRIINVHLQSTTAKAFHPLRSSTPQGMWSNLRIMMYKIKEAHLERLGQVDEVLQFIQESPHNIILCGDLNSTPFSYTYRAIRQNLRDSFETSGKGFGFTMKSRTLFFLRIDHQFYSEKLYALRLDTKNEVKYSDHFPLIGSYKLLE